MLSNARRTTIAVSGIVGSGKSSTAKAIVESLRSSGCSAEHIRFQEFVGFRGRRRSTVTSEPRGTDADTPLSPGAEMRWQGYQRRRLSAGAAAGYVLRTMLFRFRLRRWPKETVLVFDRYFYDSLVHYEWNPAALPLKLLMNAIPVPTVAALLLIGEPTILARRSRYSEEYAHQVVQAYGGLPERVPGLLVVRTDDFASVADVARIVVEKVVTKGRMEDGRVTS